MTDIVETVLNIIIVTSLSIAAITGILSLFGVGSKKRISIWKVWR